MCYKQRIDKKQYANIYIFVLLSLRAAMGSGSSATGINFESKTIFRKSSMMCTKRNIHVHKYLLAQMSGSKPRYKISCHLARLWLYGKDCLYIK